jgi:uncharacterized repeat protein (TIGR03803 family)
MITGERVSSNKIYFRIAALVFMLAAVATTATAQTYTELHNFSPNDGPNSPFFSVIAQGRDGATSNQGFTSRPGDVFKITPQGKVTELHEFSGPYGEAPIGGLTLATDGQFYGTTAFGGAFGFGTIFSITAGGTLKTLYSFQDKKDGSLPNGLTVFQPLRLIGT